MERLTRILGKDFTYTEAKSIIKELGRFTVNDDIYLGLTTITTDDGDEYAIGYDGEADDAFELVLDYYIEVNIRSKIPDYLYFYFDEDGWRRGARYDGRGHFIAAYDYEEMEVGDLFAYRMN